MSEKQEILFKPQSASFDHEPSAKLVKRAEAMKRTMERTRKLGGYFLRAANRQEGKVAKVALRTVAVPELVLELPTTILPNLVAYSVQTRRFRRELIDEYPHLKNPDYYGSDSNCQPLIGGTVESYAEAVLPQTQMSEAETNEGGSPPGDASTHTSSEVPVLDHEYPGQFTPAVEV